MLLMCLKCFNLIEKSSLKSINCCENKFAEIDNLIAPAIQVLNLKGYKTRGCCSGHLENHLASNHASYINFPKNTNFPYLPIGYIYQQDDEFIKSMLNEVQLKDINNYVLIRHYFIKSNKKICLNNLLENSKNLLNWANSLPIIE